MAQCAALIAPYRLPRICALLHPGYETALLSAQATDTVGEKKFRIPYPRPPNLPYSARVLSNEGRFLEAILEWTERELAGPGRPGSVDGLVAGGASGGAAPSLGRARCLAARGGYVNPASGGATSLHPGASRRSIPSRGSRGTGKPRTHCAARTRMFGCLNCRTGNWQCAKPHSASYPSPPARGRHLSLQLTSSRVPPEPSPRRAWPLRRRACPDAQPWRRYAAWRRNRPAPCAPHRFRSAA